MQLQKILILTGFCDPLQEFAGQAITCLCSWDGHVDVQAGDFISQGIDSILSWGDL